MEILLQKSKQKTETSESADIIIKKYADMVFRLAFARVRSKSDAEDIFQEVFLRYVLKNPAFENEEHRKAWLIRVTINCSKKFRSSAWKRKTEPLGDNLNGLVFTQPEEYALDEALKKLQPKYRSVIHLFYYEDYSVGKIGKILGIKESTVRTQLTRARARLSELLKGEF